MDKSGFCAKIYYGKLNQIIYTLSVCSHHVKNQQRCTARGIHRNIKLNVVLIGLIHKLMMLKREQSSGVHHKASVYQLRVKLKIVLYKPGS